jgi:peptidoglycan/xylan/chitin deacetylase (PgdA/CDA1 family)
MTRERSRASSSQIRRTATGMIRWLLFHSGGLRQIARYRRCGVILMFHYIEQESGEEFHELLRYLSRSFTVVSLESLLEESTGNRPPRSMVIALTFDDGLRNQRTVAYPILSDLRLPATFYVCPGLIGRANTTWTWEMWCRLPWLPEADRLELFDGGKDASDPETITNWMKELPMHKRTQLEEEIRARSPHFSYTERERNRYGLMSWNELAELDPSLINIGSHSMTHPDLPQLDQDALIGELKDSRALLETRLGRSVHDLAYPNGSHNDPVVRATAEVYRSAVTTVCGAIGPGDSVYTLKRIGATLDPQWTSWLLAIHASRTHKC